jgi:hypothetical protein
MSPKPAQSAGFPNACWGRKDTSLVLLPDCRVSRRSLNQPRWSIFFAKMKVNLRVEPAQGRRHRQHAVTPRWAPLMYRVTRSRVC